MEGNVNLIEISPVVIEVQRVENGELAVPLNNTLKCHTDLLAADTQLCDLIMVRMIRMLARMMVKMMLMTRMMASVLIMARMIMRMILAM